MGELIDTLCSREFLTAFGTFALLALALGAVLFVIAAYFVKLKRLEKQINDFEQEVNARLDKFEEETRQDFSRERHMLNESLQGISETVARAVISVSDHKQ